MVVWRTILERRVALHGGAWSGIDGLHIIVGVWKDGVLFSGIGMATFLWHFLTIDGDDGRQVIVS
jgi:hypothetical protein